MYNFYYEALDMFNNCSKFYISHKIENIQVYISNKSHTHCMYFPMSMNITMIALSLRTFRRKTCLLNFTSGSIYFFSFGLSVRTHALNMFHTTVISKRIWGQLPFARPLSFLSFNAYHRFSPLRIFSNGIATFPRNSTL